MKYAIKQLGQNTPKTEKLYSYIKLQAPVPPGPNLEPVYELKLDTQDKRYKADKISREGETVTIVCNGITQEMPWVNAVFARPI